MLSTWISCKLCLTNIIKFQMRKLSISCTISEKEMGAMEIFFTILWFIVNQNRTKVFRFAIHSCIFLVAVHWVSISFRGIFCFWHPSKGIFKSMLTVSQVNINVQFLFPGHGPSSASPEHLDSAYSQIPVSEP